MERALLLMREINDAKERCSLGGIGVDGRIILKFILVKIWIKFLDRAGQLSVNVKKIYI
jgi:hypothetical protein